MCTLQSHDRKPFVYIIRDITNGKRYGGVKFSKGCKPSDLLTKYYTSSRIVKNLIKDGREFVIDKIIEFDNKEDAIEFEELMLRTVNAHLSDDWYNLATGKAINPDAVKERCLTKYGVDNWMKTEEAKNSGLGFKSGNKHGCFERSDETKAKMSESFAGREFSEEHRQKISKARTGTKATPETRLKMSESKIGVKRPKSFSEKMSLIMSGENNPMYGNPSPRKGKKDEQIQCEHCGKFANRGNYNRWHGYNCKMRGHNTNDPHLSLNTTAAEVTTDDSIDPDVSGFIVNQNTATNINVLDATYIFLAIA